MGIKIPLFTSKALGFERKSMVTFSVEYGTLPHFYSTAIVDTGCPFFIISPGTMNKTRVPYMQKPSMDLKKPLILGGFHLDLKDLGECNLFFRDYENKIIDFVHNLYVGVPLGVQMGQAQNILNQLPSFIGDDFLSKNFLSVVKSKRDGKNYLQEIE